MEIGATSSTSSATQSNSLYGAETSEMGKEDFLKLLVAQLSNQDPLEPLNNEEFVAQMATFSQLEQLTNLNGTVESLAQGGILSSTASLLGKTVTTSELIDEEEVEITGTVEAVSFKDGKSMMTIDGNEYDVSNIIEIVQ